jgi:hypothetical protein
VVPADPEDPVTNAVKVVEAAKVGASLVLLTGDRADKVAHLIEVKVAARADLAVASVVPVGRAAPVVQAGRA